MADPTFDAVYVGAAYDGSVTIAGGLSASDLVAIVAAFGDSTSSITMSGWTQKIIGGAVSGGETVRQAIFTRAYASGTYSATLGGALNSYLLTIYAINDVGSIGASASNSANGENPASFSAGPAITNNGSLVIGAITCWGDCPKPTDITGTWTSTLGPPTLASPSLSEQRTWYNSQNAGTASFAVTKTFTNPDTGVASVIVLEASSGATYTDMGADGTVSLGSVAGLSLTANLAASGTIDLAASGNLSRTTEMSSGGTLTLSSSAELALTTDTAASASLGFTGSGNLALAANLAAGGSIGLSASGALSTGAVKFTLMYNSLGVGTWNGGTSNYAIAQSLGLSTYFPDATFVLVGSNGATTAGLISSYTADVLPEYDPSARNIIVFWEGVNSLLIPTTPAAELAQLEAFAATAQGDGFEVIVGTLLPIGFPGEDVAASDLNVLLRASSAFDGLIDLRSRLPQFSPVASNPLYDTDYDAHLSDGPTGGYAVSTAEWAEGINEYLTGVTLAADGTLSLVSAADLTRATDLSSGATLNLSASGAMSLTADLGADGPISLTGSADLGRTTELASAASVTLGSVAGLALAADLGASGTVSFTSAADLAITNNADMASGWTVDFSATAPLSLTSSLGSDLALGFTGSADLALATSLEAGGSLSWVASADLVTADTIDISAAGAFGFTGSADLSLYLNMSASTDIIFASSPVLYLTSDLASNGSILFGGSASMLGQTSARVSLTGCRAVMRSIRGTVTT